jgi:hypothetical protein
MSAFDPKRTCGRLSVDPRSGIVFGCATSILPVLLVSPPEAGPTTGGQHDNRSSNCDYSSGLRRDWHDYAGRGRQAEVHKLHQAHRLRVLGAALRRRHARFRWQHLCFESSGSAAHPAYGDRQKVDRPLRRVLPGDASGRNIRQERPRKNLRICRALRASPARRSPCPLLAVGPATLNADQCAMAPPCGLSPSRSNGIRIHAKAVNTADTRMSGASRLMNTC